MKILITTVDTAEAAGALATALLERRLAACVTVIPGATSHYWWQGKIERAQECLLLIKTEEDRVEALLSELPRLHPYEVPEGIVLAVDGALEPYARWVLDETRSSSDPADRR